MNTALRIIVGVVGALFAATAANYYLQLGWFGARAKSVFTTMLLVGLVVLFAAIRLWHEPEQ